MRHRPGDRHFATDVAFPPALDSQFLDPEQAREIHAFIRRQLAEMYDSRVAAEVVIQYGGSMKADNAMELLTQPDVDGGLIGGASLKSDSFLAIAAAANNTSSQG